MHGFQITDDGYIWRGRFRPSSFSGQLHGTGGLAALAGFFDTDGGGGHVLPRSAVRVASPEHAAWTGARLLVLADDSDSGMSVYNM